MPIRPEMKDRYPKDWKLRSKFVRFVRGKGLCENCGAPHGLIVIRTGEGTEWRHTNMADLCALQAGEDVPGAVKIILTTAHVYDHRPEAASLLNLAGWCQLCHNRHDNKMRRENRKARMNRNQMEFSLK